MGGTANIRREAKASREQEQLAKTKAQEHKANEDAKFIGFENPTLKREKKREEDAKREDEIALRKAENRRVAKMEEEEMNKLGQKKSSSSKKLTKFEIEQNKAMDAKARLKAKFAAKREAESYVNVDEIENTNKTRFDAENKEAVKGG